MVMNIIWLSHPHHASNTVKSSQNLDFIVRLTSSYVSSPNQTSTLVTALSNNTS